MASLFKNKNLGSGVFLKKKLLFFVSLSLFVFNSAFAVSPPVTLKRKQDQVNPPPDPNAVVRKIEAHACPPAPPPPPPLQFNLEPCCEDVILKGKKVSSTQKAIRLHPDRDPYFIGDPEQTLFPDLVPVFVNGQDYDFSNFKSIKDISTLSHKIKVTIPLQNSQETDLDYGYRRLPSVISIPPGNTLLEVCLFLGQGASSFAFLHHEPYPADLPASQKLKWAKDHAIEVVKIRRPQITSETINYAQKAMARDLVLHELQTKFSEKFFYQQPGLIHVAQYYHTEEDLKKGVFKQAYVPGVSALNILSQLKQALDRSQPEKSKEATQFLLEDMKFKNLEDVRQKLKALEAFYFDSHEKVVIFLAENKLSIGSAWVRGKNPDGKMKHFTTGFDLGNGGNVIWNPKTRAFWIID